jgi:hypothetical protein
VDRENTYGQMVVHIQVNGLRIRSMEMVHMNGLTKDNIQEVGFKIKFMVRENMFGLMVDIMMGNTLSTRKMDLGFIHGLMVGNMKVSGAWVDNMEKVNTLKLVNLSVSESGIMVVV